MKPEVTTQGKRVRGSAFMAGAAPRLGDWLKDWLRNRTTRQTLVLYGSQILVILLGLITAPIVTRQLAPVAYGQLSFVLALVGFFVLFFEFGVFTAGSRLLALANNAQEERALCGALTVLAVGISLTYSALTFAISFAVDRVFHTSVGGIVRAIAPLVAIYPFRSLLDDICTGMNRITTLSLLNVGPKAWYLAGLLLFIGLTRVSVLTVLVLNLSGLAVISLAVFAYLKPTFRDLRRQFGLILQETRRYGFPVYCGRVVNVSTYELDKMFIAYFVNATQVGFYNLAMMFTDPMVLFSRSLSTSLFKGFTQADRIHPRVLILNAAWLSLCLLGLSILARVLVVFLFTEEYLGVVPLVLPLALAGLFKGMCQPYNQFLAAKGKGQWLRNMAWVMAGWNLLCNFLFIPPLGAVGAAIASAVSMAFSIFLYLVYYRRYLRELDAR